MTRTHARVAVTVTVDAAGLACIRDMPLFDGTTDQLLDEIGVLAGDGYPHLVITPNVDQVLSLEDDAAWRDAFDTSTLRIADGAPLVALAHLLGAPAVERITGADLLPTAIAQSRSRDWRIAIVGGADASLDRVTETDRLRVLHLPMLHSAADPASLAAIDQLHAFGPHLVFVCLGSPKQELWYLAWRHVLPGAVYVGAGGSADFLAGRFVRAPKGAQRMGLEWLWRLAQEPRRLAHRYLVKGPRFIGVATRSLRAHRTQRAQSMRRNLAPR